MRAGFATVYQNYIISVDMPLALTENTELAWANDNNCPAATKIQRAVNSKLIFKNHEI